MQKPSQSVPLDSALAHFAADYQSAAATLILNAPQLPAKQIGRPCGNTQNHQGSLLSLGGAVQAVEASMPAQSHRGGKDHQPILL
jgi:hypothetical protein